MPTKIARSLAALEATVRDCIDVTYLNRQRDDVGAGALHDYVLNMRPDDHWLALIETEMAHERRHRRMFPACRSAIPAATGARLLVLYNVGMGAALSSPPDTADWLQLRRTAVEARALGWLIRDAIAARGDLGLQLRALDYSASVHGRMGR